MRLKCTENFVFGSRVLIMKGDILQLGSIVDYDTSDPIEYEAKILSGISEGQHLEMDVLHISKYFEYVNS